MKKTSPWVFIPTLYLAEGFPYIIINVVSVLLYADLGFQNDTIAFWTGWLYLPWILKMFWSPFVDANSTKRRWLVIAQTVLGALFLVIAEAVFAQTFFEAKASGNLTFFTFSLFGFLFGAFASATLDIATDGYYLLALTTEEQSYFVGIRTIFYRLAMILGSGILISVVGSLAQHGFAKPYNWAIFFMNYFC